MFLLMTMISSLKPLEKIYSVIAPLHQNFFCYDDDQSSDTTRINNYSVTAPSALICFGDENVQYLETTNKTN